MANMTSHLELANLQSPMPLQNEIQSFPTNKKERKEITTYSSSCSKNSTGDSFSVKQELETCSDYLLKRNGVSIITPMDTGQKRLKIEVCSEDTSELVDVKEEFAADTDLEIKLSPIFKYENFSTPHENVGSIDLGSIDIKEEVKEQPQDEFATPSFQFVECKVMNSNLIFEQQTEEIDCSSCTTNEELNIDHSINLNRLSNVSTVKQNLIEKNTKLRKRMKTLECRNLKMNTRIAAMEEVIRNLEFEIAALEEANGEDSKSVTNQEET